MPVTRLSCNFVCSLFDSIFHSIIPFHIPVQRLETPTNGLPFSLNASSWKYHKAALKALKIAKKCFWILDEMGRFHFLGDEMRLDEIGDGLTPTGLGYSAGQLCEKIA